MTQLNFYQRAINYLYKRSGLSSQMAPKYVGNDVVTGHQYDFTSFDEEQKIRALRYITWIYADIAMLARMTWAADFRMKEPGKSRKMIDVPDHPFLDIYHNPNPWMTKNYLIEYMLGWLMTSRRGAFWFLSPDKNDLSKLVEIWPMNSNQVQVVKGKDYIKHFLYHPKNSQEKPLPIDPRYVVWFRYGKSI